MNGQTLGSTVVSQLLRSEAVSQNKLRNWDSKTVL